METLMKENLKIQNMMEKVRNTPEKSLIYLEIGVLTKANGKKYVGDFKNGSRNGKGKKSPPKSPRLTSKRCFFIP
jgi:hypothetical protein